MTRRRWAGGSTALAIFAACVAGAQALAEVQTIEFEGIEVVSRLGGDADRDGVVDGAEMPGTIDEAGARLRVRLSGPACTEDAIYRWEIDGVSTPANRPRPQACEFQTFAPGEGEHEITVEATTTDAKYVGAAEFTAADHLILSIGDSVASGEGNPDVRGTLARSATWLQRPCHRSMLSGHAQAALQIERGERSSAVSFVPLGCSGATVPDGLLGPYEGIQPRAGETFPAQVQEVNAIAGRRMVDAVLLSIGANDIGFSDIVIFCARYPRCDERGFDPEHPRSEAKGPGARPLDAVITSQIASLKERYSEVDESLSEEIPRERVLAVEYFDPTIGPDGFCRAFFDRGSILGWNLPALITPAEAEWAHRRVLGPLNDALRAAADEHGWTYIDGVARAFEQHGVCAPGAERWVRTANESFVRQGGLSGTMHPNEAGHLATARLIRPALAAVLGASVDETLAEGEDDAGGEAPLGLGWLAFVLGACAVLAGGAAIVVALSRRR
jgi:hypothetical protein